MHAASLASGMTLQEGGGTSTLLPQFSPSPSFSPPPLPGSSESSSPLLVNSVDGNDVASAGFVVGDVACACVIGSDLVAGDCQQQ